MPSKDVGVMTEASILVRFLLSSDEHDKNRFMTQGRETKRIPKSGARSECAVIRKVGWSNGTEAPIS